MMASDPAPTPAAPSDGRWTRRQSAALILAAAIVVTGALLIPPTLFRGLDFQRLHDPLKGYLANAVREGRLPLWNPHVALGRPFLADAEVAAFYPTTPLFLLLDARLAAGLALLAHLALALFGTVRLARKLGAAPGPSHVAMLFAASTGFFAIFQGGAFQYACAFCWMPLVLCQVLSLRDQPSARGVATLALLFGLQLLCHPQPAWLTGYAAAALIVGAWRGPAWMGLKQTLRALGALALAAGWGAGIAAVQLFPLAELISQSNRATGSFALASAFASPLAAWGTLLLPATDFIHLELSGQLYAGSAIALAGLAGLTRIHDRHTRALLVLALAAGFLAAGDATPVFRPLYHLVPFLSMLRLPARAGVLVALAVALSAARFLSRLDTPRSDVRRQILVGGAGFLLALAFSRLPELHTGHRWPLHLISLLATAGLLVLFLRPTIARWRRVAFVGLAILTTLELTLPLPSLKAALAGPPDYPGEGKVQAALVGQGLLAPGAPPPRISIPFPAVRENAGMQRGWSTFTGFGPGFLGRVWNAVHTLRGLRPPLIRNAFPADNIYDGGPFPYDGMSLVLGYDRASARVGFRQPADPRAWLVTQATVVADATQALGRMRQGHDVHTVALLEAPLARPLGTTTPPGSARIVRFLPEAIDLAVASPGPALLVLGEAWYPGWTALVDGQPAPVLPANGWMRAIPLSAGASRVELRFHSTWLLAGAMLSVLALGASLLLRRPPRPGPKTGARVAPVRGS